MTSDGFDTNGDGIADAWNFDTNGDGLVDQTGFDTDGDGRTDTWWLDDDGDLIADRVALDLDRDGLDDTVLAFAGAPASDSGDGYDELSSSTHPFWGEVFSEVVIDAMTPPANPFVSF